MKPKAKESPQEREARIRADVFRPDETDLQYAQRRMTELGVTQVSSATEAQEPPKFENRVAEILLGKPLVPAPEYDGEGPAFKTKDETFFFIETDEPVMSDVGLPFPKRGKRKPVPTGKKRWALEYGVTRHSSDRMEPDDYDIVEDSKHDSLLKAVTKASDLLHNWKVNDVLESVSQEMVAAPEN